MIVARFKIRCVPERAEEMLRILEAVVAPSRAMRGVLHFDVARDITDPNAFIATEVFEDHDALKRQNLQAEVGAVMQRLNDQFLTAAPEWTIYEARRVEGP